MECGQQRVRMGQDRTKCADEDLTVGLGSWEQ